jgi:hypothetical protein
MSARWGRPPVHVDAVPVEMRFIDMFMAALGALIFMALLLAYLLKYMPHDAQGGAADPGRPPEARALVVATRRLPAAQAGEPYEVALAYRGGRGPVTWNAIPSGRALPEGLVLDVQNGIIRGQARVPVTSRFVLRAQDREHTVDQALELIVEPSRKGRSSVEKWVTAILLVLMALFWLLLVGLNATLKRQVAQLEAALNNGERAVEWLTGAGVRETIALPEGITTYRERQEALRPMLLGVAVAVVLFASFFVWRLWRG